MTPERFAEVKEMIRKQFSVRAELVQPCEPQPGTEEIVEFESPHGIMRAIFTSRPRLQNVKVLASRRIGSHAVEERHYDPTTIVHHFSIQVWNADLESWDEVNADAVFSSTSTPS